MNQAIPYDQRCERTESGVAVIWPFLNVQRSRGELELFLDTNALTRSKWLSELSEDQRRYCVVNPWMAIQEQWFSNSCFRNDPESRINGWIKNLERYGVKFRSGYASDQVQLLMKNEIALRRQFSSIVPFVAIMKCLLSQKMPVDDSLARLKEMGQSEIPRFTGVIALIALGISLKKEQAFKLVSDPKPAYSYLSSFLGFQPAGKDESDYMNVSYLRNRAGDLNTWLGLPVLRQLGLSIGSHSALATGDKALHRLIFRAIPPVMLPTGATAFSVVPNELSQETYERVVGVVQSLQARQGATLDEQLARMKTVFSLAKEWTNDQRERDALDEVFSDWWLPGHGMEIMPL